MSIACETRLDSQIGVIPDGAADTGLSVTQAAAFTGLSKRTIATYLKDGALPGARKVAVGGRVLQWRIPAEALVPFLPEV